MTIIRQKEEIILSEAEFLAIEKTLDILSDIISESEDDDTLNFADDAKGSLIELLKNAFKRN